MGFKEETLRVLVVDDEKGMRLGLARALEDFVVELPDLNLRASFAVNQAETAEEGLRLIEAQPPDLLLLDYKLPGMTGLELLEKIDFRHADLLVIMITAYASIETAVTATRLGAYDFLPKPFTPAELRSTVHKTTHRLVLSREARRLAEERRQVRFQFVRVLGHELKAPLNAVEGYLRICRDRTVGDDQAVYDQMLDRSLLRLEYMRKLIMDLLDMTRLESGVKRRDLTEINLREVAAAALENVTPDATRRGIVLALDAPEQVPLRGDLGELQIVLNNLVSNAVKYNRDGGRVDVKLSQADGLTTLTVADTGIGLTEAEAGKLFGEFVRIKNQKTMNILGSGLGLSIVKKVAELYGGEAKVQSVAEQGSTFTVTLRDAATEAAEE